MPERVLLVDYPHPDGEARAAALRTMGCELLVFNLMENRLWPGAGPAKAASARLLRTLRPLYALAGALDRYKLNTDLLAAAREFRPDIVLVVKGDRFSAGTYSELRKIGRPLMINWYPDSVTAADKRDFVAAHRKIFDHFFLVDELEALPEDVRARIAAGSPGIHTLPLAANTDHFRPLALEAERKRALEGAVSFVGAVNPARKAVLASLEGPALRIWAPLESPWGKWLDEGSPLGRCYQGGGVFGRELVEVYGGSAILLDVHFLFPEVERIVNVTTRVYEVPAAGGFVLTNASAQLPKLFEPGVEIVCYDSVEDLKDKVNYYLSHPGERAGIARLARQRVLRDHTYANRLSVMAETAGFARRPGGNR
ncbi:MAG: glycosyltransferase [Elusimicrobia bacterium]|nr:glycosyltransferase [Elusimicrobiota bacterium]